MKSILVKSAMLALAGVFGSAAYAEPDFTMRAHTSVITQPSETTKLAFQDLGIVSKVLVKEGDAVTASQLLMQLDDEMDQVQVKQLQVEADSTARIEAAEAEQALRKSEFDKIMGAPAGFPPREREEARLKVIAAEKQVKVAQEDHETAKLKFQGAQVKLNRMHLKAPFDGLVQKLVVKVGESIDPQRDAGALVLVKNDPLWVEVKGIPTKDVAKLKLGDDIEVRYEDDGAAGTWLKGKIILISPVADASSKTQMFRLELPNPERRASGLRMDIKIPGVDEMKAANAGNQ